MLATLFQTITKLDMIYFYDLSLFWFLFQISSSNSTAKIGNFIQNDEVIYLEYRPPHIFAVMRDIRACILVGRDGTQMCSRWWWIQDWKHLHRLSESLASLGMRRDKFRASVKPLNTIGLWWSSIGDLQWGPNERRFCFFQSKDCYI